MATDFQPTAILSAQDKYRMLGNTDFGKPVPVGKKKSSGIGRWLLIGVIAGLVIAFGQFHQRNKVDAQAVKEGRLPAITIK
jgi:hypothetical protein